MTCSIIVLVKYARPRRLQSTRLSPASIVRSLRTLDSHTFPWICNNPRFDETARCRSKHVNRFTGPSRCPGNSSSFSE